MIFLKSTMSFLVLFSLYLTCGISLTSRHNYLKKTTNQIMSLCDFDCMNYSFKELNDDYNSFKSEFDSPLNSVAYLCSDVTVTVESKVENLDCTLISTEKYETDHHYNSMNIYSEYSNWSLIDSGVFISLGFARTLANDPLYLSELLNSEIIINGTTVLIAGIYSASINEVNYNNKGDYFNSAFNNPIFVSDDLFSQIVNDGEKRFGVCFLNKKSVNDASIDLLLNSFVSFSIENYGGCHNKSHRISYLFSILGSNWTILKIISWTASLLLLSLYIFMILHYCIDDNFTHFIYLLVQMAVMLLIATISGIIQKYIPIPLISSGSVVLVCLILCLFLFYFASRYKTIYKKRKKTLFLETDYKEITI